MDYVVSSAPLLFLLPCRKEPYSAVLGHPQGHHLAQGSVCGWGNPGHPQGVMEVAAVPSLVQDLGRVPQLPVISSAPTVTPLVLSSEIYVWVPTITPLYMQCPYHFGEQWTSYVCSLQCNIRLIYPKMIDFELQRNPYCDISQHGRQIHLHPVHI